MRNANIMSHINPNDRYGKLIVIECVGTSKDRHKLWKCKCDCGNFVVVPTNSLTTGNTKSCGCIVREQKTRLTHGMHGTRLYRIWGTMKARCKYSTHIEAKNYHDRGIKVCDEWSDSFDAFKSWAEASGYGDTLTIDRINVNGDYEPHNCRWVTQKEQCNNKRNNIVLTINGEKHTVTEWSYISGVSRTTIYNRLKRGVEPYDAVFSKPKGVKV